MGKNKVILGKKFDWIKKYYLNGKLHIFGSLNLYGIWNGLLYKTYRLCQTRWGKTRIK